MFTIKRLRLIGNKRLMLNNISDIELTPNSVFQIIIGTNGSGKSSLLRELSPLPPATSDYHKDGSKTIELEDQAAEYILTSKNNKHTFIRNGEVLNDEGTGTVQKELVRRYFGYTDDIHDILMGDEELTFMSPQRRREWFTRLTPNNIQYAIETFNKIKSKHRETTGAIAHVKRRLTTETNNLLCLTDVDNLQQRVDILQQDVVILLENKVPGVRHNSGIENTIENKLFDIKKLSERIMRTSVDMFFINQFRNINEVEDAYNEVQEQYKLTEQLLQLRSSEYNDLEVLLRDIQAAGVDGIDDLLKKEKLLKNRIENGLSNIKRFKTIANIEIIVLQNDEVVGAMSNILQSLPANENNYFNRETINEYVSEKKTIEEKLSIVSAKKSRSEERLEHIREAKETDCPKCGYRWIPGVSENEVKTLTGVVENAEKEIGVYKDRLSYINEYLEKADEYVSAWRVMKNFMDANPNHKPLFDLMIEDKVIHQNPKRCFDFIVDWNRDIGIVYENYKMSLELTNVETAKAAVESIQKVQGTTAFNDRVSKLAGEIDELTNKLNIYKIRLERIGSILKSIKSLYVDYQLLETMLDEMDQLFIVFQQSTKNQILDETLMDVNKNLRIVQDKLTEKQNLENLIADLTKDLDTLEKDQLALKELMDELSPTNGLIADQLFGNVNCIVSQMNDIISQMWTYDLEIKPCGFDSGELDYKFPLLVPSKDIFVVDILKGSDAQKEVINFAFKIVVMLYLNMSNNPLFLDEVGITFDEQHRTNLMTYVKLLIDSKRFSQLFMVSHYAAQYGAMTTAEVCVLDDTNISTSMVYNKHVKIK